MKIITLSVERSLKSIPWVVQICRTYIPDIVCIFGLDKNVASKLYQEMKFEGYSAERNISCDACIDGMNIFTIDSTMTRIYKFTKHFFKTKNERQFLHITAAMASKVNIDIIAVSFDADLACKRGQYEEIGTYVENLNNVVVVADSKILKWQEPPEISVSGLTDVWKEYGTASNEANMINDRVDRVYTNNVITKYSLIDVGTNVRKGIYVEMN